MPPGQDSSQSRDSSRSVLNATSSPKPTRQLGPNYNQSGIRVSTCLLPYHLTPSHRKLEIPVRVHGRLPAPRHLQIQGQVNDQLHLGLGGLR